MVSSLLVRRAASLPFAGAALIMISAAVAGCGSNTTIQEQAYASATISPTADDATSCMMAPGTQFLTIGSLSGTDYSLVQNGSSFDGASVQVDCSVVPSGGGFTVNATAQRSGDQTGGTVSLIGTFTATGTQSGLSVTFGSGSTGIYQQMQGCSATYTESNMGVAAGRVWAIVSCPDMQLENQANQCAGQAELRFENCGQ